MVSAYAKAINWLRGRRASQHEIDSAEDAFVQAFVESMRRRRHQQVEDIPRRVRRWVRVHRDPLSMYTYVYLSNASPNALPLLKIDESTRTYNAAEITERIADALVGVCCIECGQEPGEGRGVCPACTAAAIADLVEVARDDD